MMISSDVMVGHIQTVSIENNNVYTTKPVQTEFGWHVILREASRDAISPTLDSVRLELEQQIRQTRFQEYINSLREKSL